MLTEIIVSISAISSLHWLSGSAQAMALWPLRDAALRGEWAALVALDFYECILEANGCRGTARRRDWARRTWRWTRCATTCGWHPRLGLPGEVTESGHLIT